VSGVDVLDDFRRKRSVEFTSMKAINGEDIFYRKMGIVDVNNGDMFTYRAMSTPIAEPERRRA